MFLRDFSPALRYGAKITAQDIAGMVGLPVVGNIWYVDAVNGNDSSSGNDPKSAFKTVTAAKAALTNNNNDVVVLCPSGPGTGEPYATVETAAITWNLNLTHIIGNVSPVVTSQRARIATATNALSPFFTISGQGCIFKNINWYNPGTTNYINVRVSGKRNYFENCHFAGIADDTCGNNATGSSLELYGAQENYFVNCTIGLDTVTRTAANANLRIVLGSDTVARNVFDGCIFTMVADADAPRFIIQADSVGMDRWNIFRGCQFINCIGSTSTNQTDAFSVHATPGGLIVLQDCLKIGTTGWANNLTSLYLLSVSSNGTYADGIGFAVNPGA